jgi:hypothetical protein
MRTYITAKRGEIGFGGATGGLDPGAEQIIYNGDSEAGSYEGRSHLDV